MNLIFWDSFSNLKIFGQQAWDIEKLSMTTVSRPKCNKDRVPIHKNIWRGSFFYYF